MEWTAYVLLDDLEPDGQLHAPGDVKAAVVAPEEHANVRVAAGVLLLQRNGGHDLVVLAHSTRLLHIAVVGAQTSEDLARLCVTSHLNEPSRGLCAYRLAKGKV